MSVGSRPWRAENQGITHSLAHSLEQQEDFNWSYKIFVIPQQGAGSRFAGIIPARTWMTSTEKAERKITLFEAAIVAVAVGRWYECLEATVLTSTTRLKSVKVLLQLHTVNLPRQIKKKNLNQRATRERAAVAEGKMRWEQLQNDSLWTFFCHYLLSSSSPSSSSSSSPSLQQRSESLSGLCWLTDCPKKHLFFFTPVLHQHEDVHSGEGGGVRDLRASHWPTQQMTPRHGHRTKTVAALCDATLCPHWTRCRSCEVSALCLQPPAKAN